MRSGLSLLCAAAIGVAMLLSAPIAALITGLYLSAVHRAVAGMPASRGAVLRAAVGALRPVTIALVIGALLVHVGILIGRFSRPAVMGLAPHPGQWLAGPLMCLLPVVCVVEQCGFWAGVRRMFSFIHDHLWRFVVFIAVAAAIQVVSSLIVMPLALTYGSGAPLRPALMSALPTIISFFVHMLLAGALVRFYVERAGTVDVRLATRLAGVLETMDVKRREG